MIKCNLQAILTERMMSQAELARMSGKRTGCISVLARGLHNPRRKTAKDIAAVLGLSVYDIWPEYEQWHVQLKQQISDGLKAYFEASGRKLPPKAANPRPVKAANPRPVKAVDLPVHPSSPNAVPLADDAHADEFRLRPAVVLDELLQDGAWCRAQARRMHEYIVRACAYGVYRELRELMAAENRLFEERAKALREAR